MTKQPGWSRRAVLAGAAALVGTSARGADYEVVVIGAGAAGLAAARRLAGLGLTAIVIEARDRLGGRIHTDDRLGVPFDAGAQYIHWAERNPWKDIARQQGVATEEETGNGTLSVVVEGRVMPAAERGRRRSAFALVDDLIHRASDPDRSIADAVGSAGTDARDAATGLCRLSLGEEPDRVSSLDYDQLWSGEDLVMPAGYGNLLGRFASGLPVRLACGATAVDWSGAGVTVETPAGAITARAAILTVSIGVLQAGAIAFRPALPSGMTDALGGIGMGAYTKVALRLDPATALAASAWPDTIDFDRDGDAVSFEFRPFGRSIVLGYCGGDFARHLCEAGERAAVDHATARLAAVFGERLRDGVTSGALAGWWTDPYARGSYSIARPGRHAARAALRVPVGDRIWLAGEASAEGGAMTAGGAFLEGVRAADDVARRLRA